MENNALTQQLAIQLVSGSLQDIQEIIEFLQWAFRKVDKGDTPEETVRMLLMNRAKIDNIKFNSGMLCGSFDPDNKTSSATKCKCGREKWEHPKPRN